MKSLKYQRWQPSKACAGGGAGGVSLDVLRAASRVRRNALSL